MIERVVTSGTFTLDGGTWEVDNNVWLIGDGREMIVVDAAHDADAIAVAVGDRRVLSIVCTHAHDDHVNAAPELSRRLAAPVLPHPAETGVRTGHGETTTIGGETAHLGEWLVRRH